MRYPTSPFERAVDDAIAAENARYLDSPEGRAATAAREEREGDRLLAKWCNDCQDPHYSETDERMSRIRRRLESCPYFPKEDR